MEGGGKSEQGKPFAQALCTDLAESRGEKPELPERKGDGDGSLSLDACASFLWFYLILTFTK